MTMARTHTNSSRRSAVIIGVLFIAGLVTGIFSVVPVIDGADYLVKASTNETQVLLGAFSQLLMVIAYVGIPILLYPIVSNHHKGIALGSVAFGIMAGVFIVLGVIILLLLLALSHHFAIAGTAHESYYQALGELLREGRDLVNHVATTLAFVIAMFLFNCQLYRTELIPRWLSLSGLIGSALSILASLLFMLGSIGLDTAYMLLNVPIAIQQLVVALWLILKGFKECSGEEVSQK
ncbi:DUF4386 domain-containing protein [Paenibacillus sp. J5C_2022]|uniref:DUF4386 domain-containing protein n=1 Tax=Paenibacillus sp. J5C2022 TaxID=2977129 RepID=UPI0021D29268|nr:DUF4386 domain-containing protein [Paenibacillus sp. J5C2022]MCU6710486.1 DUF4386 domain-containing protein [Paenibacillus sp. J5C2022]